MKLIKLLRPYGMWIIAILVLTYLQVKANLLLPDYMAKIINDGIIAEDQNSIWNNGWLMLVISLGGSVVAVTASLLASRIATGYARDLRHKIFSHVENFSINEFNKFSTASLITRSTNDIQQIQMVMVMMLRIMLVAPLMAFGALQNATADAPSLTWIIALAAGSILAVIIFLFIVVLPRFAKIQKLVDKLNLVTRENLTGLRVVRAFNKEATEEKKFNQVNYDLTRLNLFVNRMMVMVQPMMMLIMNMSVIAILWYGAKQIDIGDLSIGNMMAFMQYAMQVIMSFLMFSVIFIMVPRAYVSAKRIAEVLNTESTILDPKIAEEFKSNSGIVEFKNVSFAYPEADEPTLRDISFIAEAGKTTAIIGSTGSGKSTLINLIPRFYDVTHGQILVDGTDVRNVHQHDLFSRIGYIPQKGVLFSGNIKSNISYGKHDLDEKSLKRAARIAQASEFIDKLDDKYDYSIAQGGTNVSGGQKQRLSIARALAVDPEIFIFDDSFSALDLKTDQNLRKALKKETKGKTVIIVGQRISTIMDADKILVLDEGRLVAQGSHEELMKSSRVYQEIAHSQLSDEELANIKKVMEAM